MNIIAVRQCWLNWEPWKKKSSKWFHKCLSSGLMLLSCINVKKVFCIKGSVNDRHSEHYNTATSKYLPFKDIVKSWLPEQRLKSRFLGVCCYLSFLLVVVVAGPATHACESLCVTYWWTNRHCSAMCIYRGLQLIMAMCWWEKRNAHPSLTLLALSALLPLLTQFALLTLLATCQLLSHLHVENRAETIWILWIHFKALLKQQHLNANCGFTVKIDHDLQMTSL